MKIKRIAMKKTNWKVIFKVIIAVATAIAGVIGGQAMTFLSIVDRRREAVIREVEVRITALFI